MKTAPPTPFQSKVYETVRHVPQSMVATYSLIAARIGCRSPRAVGQALRKNPFAPEVPCHRVISSDGSLGGFFGHTGGPELTRKRRLLEAEGVRFDAWGKVLPEHILS
ncbi:MAG: MGMT family protein [Terrimicrobiaceae bacterium]